MVAAMGGEGRTVLQRVEDYPKENLTLPLLVDLMEREGMSIASGRTTQLTSELVDAADRVIVMAQREAWPPYLIEGERVTFWDIQDPVNVTAESAQEVIVRIKSEVEELVKEFG